MEENENHLKSHQTAITISINILMYTFHIFARMLQKLNHDMYAIFKFLKPKLLKMLVPLSYSLLYP